MIKISCAAAVMAATSVFAAPAPAAGPPPPDAVTDLAPTGKLRAAINTGNTVLVQKDAAGQVHGVTVDLATELARRLGVAADFIIFDAAGKVTQAVKTGAWDIAFVAIEPKRSEGIGFTAPYLVIEGTYMVSTASPLKTIGDVDRDGIRIAVAKGSAYDLYLTRTLAHATLVRYPTPPLALDGFVADKIDAAAGVKQPLVDFAKLHPDFRVMDGHFQEIRQAMGVPLGRDAGLQYLKTFIEEMKASGFVRSALDRAGQSDVAVAPPAPN